MPRYYFDLYDDFDAADPEGRELPDLETAVAYAVKEARNMMHASISETGRIDLCHRIEVRNEAGAIAHVLHFEDAIAVQRGADLIGGSRDWQQPGR